MTHLLIDIGNSTTVAAIADKQGNILGSWRFDTMKDQGGAYYAESLRLGINRHGLDADDIAKTIISSVVPEVNGFFVDATYRITSATPHFFSLQDVENMMAIDVDNPLQVGKDRLADAVGAMTCYGCPAIVIDMGTATTVGVITKERKFVGGMIMPGVKTSLKALCERASQLTMFEEWTAQDVVGRTTEACMQSGTLYGTACMIDGIVDRLEEKYLTQFNIVATGGMAKFVVPYCKREIKTDKYLLLKGLFYACH